MSAWILVAEDDPDDRELLALAFQTHGLECSYEMVNDGEAARARLLQALSEGRPPAALLTDLKLPRVSGLELLEWMAGKPELGFLPRAVLTSSSEATDESACMRLGCRAFLQKPSDLDGYEGVVEAVRALMPGA